MPGACSVLAEGSSLFRRIGIEVSSRSGLATKSKQPSGLTLS